MKTPELILERLKPLSSVEGFHEVERFLRDPATRLHYSKSDGRVAVKMIDHAWGARLQIAQDKGRKSVPGCEHLVQSLAYLPEATILKMVVLEGECALGAVWFVEETDEPVGFVVADLSIATRPLPN